MSIVIGLTGPTGAGKSVATKIAEEMGVKVVDCDKVARRVTEKGKPALLALKKAFGEDILEENGELNRKLLAKKAFSLPENTNLLNSTVFPFVLDEIKQEINAKKVLLDAPTLFESGIDNICFDTVAILANDSIRLERIMERDNISLEDAKIRMSAGKPNDFYTKRTNNIIYNNEDLEEYLNEISAVFKKLFKGE